MVAEAMMETIKDCAQLLFWLITGIGAVIAAFRAIREMQRANDERAEAVQQQRDQLRWRQAEMARTVLDKLWGNTLARAAMKMLDWKNKVFSHDGVKTDPITTDLLLNALRTHNLSFNRNEAFVRDAFDELFDELGKIEHYLKIGLVLWEDVRDQLQYHVTLLALHRGEMNNFLQQYNYASTSALLARFPEWK
jgi:hypothetical protein